MRLMVFGKTVLSKKGENVSVGIIQFLGNWREKNVKIFKVGMEARGEGERWERGGE